MSWLNSSLNSIKGQITSFAQEVLAEVPIQDEEINPVQALEESQKRNEELNLLCASKDSEIAALRRQIVEFQAKCAESGRSSKSSLEKNASLEDSWIWEPENVLSDSSVKNDHEANSETSSGGEMITIPLDIATATESSSYEKLCKTSEDNQKLKKLVQENAALSEKVAQLRAKNKILNENLEELDSQHNAVIQKLLALKDELQEKFHKVSEDYEKLKTVHENEALNHERELDAVNKNLATYLSENEELKRSLDSLEECILKHTTENVNVKANLELKDKQLLELIEKIENWEGQNHQQHHEKRDNEIVIDKLQKENDNFRKILEELGLDVEELKNGKELKNVFVKKHRVEDGFIILEDGDLGDGISWKQKYDELLLVKKELLDKLDESNQFPSTHKELEAEVELLRNTATSLDEQNKTYLDKINSLQQSQLLENAAIDKKREQMETEIDLEIKVALLEKEKSILQSENQMNLARLEELKKVQTIDPEDYEKLKSDNEQLQENFSAANEEFMEYQEEQTKIRTKLEMRMKQLETEVLETQNKLHKAGNNEELELKVALLEKEKSILENDLLTNLERIEKLKISKTIDNEEYETIIEKNRQLQENFESANEEFMEYQEEQAKIRGELEAKVEYLENQIKECKILSSAVSMDNRCDKQTVKTIEIDEQLQKEDHHDDICKNFEQKVECLEKEISDANKSKQEIVRQLEEYKQFAVKNSELQQKLTKFIY